MLCSVFANSALNLIQARLSMSRHASTKFGRSLSFCFAKSPTWNIGLTLQLSQKFHVTKLTKLTRTCLVLKYVDTKKCLYEV